MMTPTSNPLNDQLLLHAMSLDDDEWEEYLAGEMADVSCQELSVAVEELLGREILQAGAATVEVVEQAFVHTVWLLEVLMRSGGGPVTLGEVMRTGITRHTGFRYEDVDLERRLLNAFAAFFEGWFSIGKYRQMIVPTAILYSLLPELCTAVGPAEREQVLPTVLKRLLDGTGRDDARLALDECVSDYCA